MGLRRTVKCHWRRPIHRTRAWHEPLWLFREQSPRLEEGQEIKLSPGLIRTSYRDLGVLIASPVSVAAVLPLMLFVVTLMFSMVLVMCLVPIVVLLVPLAVTLMVLLVALVVASVVVVVAMLAIVVVWLRPCARQLFKFNIKPTRNCTDQL